MCFVDVVFEYFYYVRDDTVTSRDGINKVFCKCFVYIFSSVCFVDLFGETSQKEARMTSSIKDD